MELIGFSGYLFACFAYLIFSMLLVAARNKTFMGAWILISSIVSLVVLGVASTQIQVGFSLKWVLLIENIKTACWAILLLSCNTEFNSVKRFFADFHIRKYILTWSVLMAAFWGLTTWAGFPYEYLFLLFVILNLWNLVLLEQLFRSADEKVRRAIWPLVIAIGSISVFDFVMFSQASMVGQINFDYWYSRGFLAAFVVPFLLISTRRIKEGSVRVFVSRNVVFYSSMLLIAGVYLLIMAFAGYLINYIGGEWGNLVSITFLMLGGVVLIVLLMTESLRRKVKVFIAKHFFANKYEYREEWLNLIEKIETTSAESYYQMATQIMMSKLNVGQGAIVKRVTDTQFKVQYSEGLNFDTSLNRELGKFVTFCQKNSWIIDIQEYRVAPSLYSELFLELKVCEEHKISAVVPIYIGKAFYGFFIFAQAKEISPLNWEDRDLFFAMAKQLGNFISLHEANDKLAESKQFDAFNRMSAFLVHDLKNVQAQLSLINTNAEKHRDNPEFIDDVFETIESATQRLDKMLNQLRNKQLNQSESTTLSLNTLFEKVVRQRNIELPKVELNLKSHIKMRIDGETFYSVLNHLIQNAQEATANDGVIGVMVDQVADSMKIIIEDNGSGMSEEFINKRLFKPFDTTKGNSGMGIGVYEAKQFIEGIAGTIEVASIVGKGTKFTIMLPLNPIFETNK